MTRPPDCLICGHELTQHKVYRWLVDTDITIAGCNIEGCHCNGEVLYVEGVVKVRKRYDKMNSLLRKLEWSAWNIYDSPCCPRCNGDKPGGHTTIEEGHAIDCDLKGALGE